eukprot:270945_1
MALLVHNLCQYCHISHLLLYICLTFLQCAWSYRISPTANFSWNQAKTYCQQTYGSSLATIYSPTQNQNASQLCISSTDSQSTVFGCWIGLHKATINSSWIWDENNLNSTMFEWSLTEPNNNNHELCVEIRLKPYWRNDQNQYTFPSQWNDADCTTQNRFALCNDPSSANYAPISIQNNAWYHIYPIGGVTKIAPDNVLDEDNHLRKYLSSHQSGTKIDLWYQDDGSGRQKWVFEYIGNDIYNIRVYGGVNDLYYLSATSNGNTVNMSAIDTGSGSEQWILEQVNNWFYIKINTNNTNRYLSVTSAIIVPLILVENDDSSGRQRWHLEIGELNGDIIETISHNYYFNYNRRNWSDAQDFCQKHCESSLASIHSEYDYKYIRNMLLNSPIDISDSSSWFGLNFINQNAISNIDNSLFDYPKTFRLWPWYELEPNNNNQNQLCYAFWHTENYELDDTRCDIKSRFICNHCKWNKLTKYVMVSDSLNWTNADNYCKSKYKTSLASMHSIEDYNELSLVCRNINCWIGLNDWNTENIFEWSDGSPFLWTTTNSEWPWRIGNPDNNGGNNSENCVELLLNGVYEFNDAQCQFEYAPICMIPSEICDATKWKNVSTNWIFTECAINYTGNNVESISLNSVSTAKWNKLNLEYIYNIQPISGTDNNKKVGILFNIYNLQTSVVHEIFIGMRYVNHSMISLVIDFDNIEMVNVHFPEFSNGISVVLNVLLNDNGTFHCTLNNKYDISYDLINTFLNYYVQSMSLYNEGILAISTSLYINGGLYTIRPSQHPSVVPTLAPTYISFNGTAKWSFSFRSIYVYITENNDGNERNVFIETSSLNNICDDIFDDETSVLLATASCIWRVNTYDYDAVDYDIEIILTSSSIIDFETKNITIKVGAFSYYINNDIHLNNLSQPIYITSITIPSLINRVKPAISVSYPSTIGVCDDFGPLDARNTANLGARPHDALFEWTIFNVAVVSRNGASLVSFNSSIMELIPGNSVIYVELRVINWYGAESLFNFTAYKSVKSVIPNIQINGINEINSNTVRQSPLNGQIELHATISIHGIDCDGNSIDMNQFDNHLILWYLKITKINLNDNLQQFDINVYDELTSYLQSYNQQTALQIDSDKYLIPGFNYEFILNFKCNSDIYECDVNATHSLIYNYGEIVCQIEGGRGNIIEIPFSSVSGTSIVLDGDTFTYDPDGNDDNLLFEWSCSSNCDHVIKDVTASVVTISDLTTEISTQHLFTFSMEVYDSTNLYRPHCNDSISLKLINDTLDLIPLTLSCTAQSSTINVNEKVRIICDILFGKDVYINNINNNDIITVNEW